MQTRAHVAGQRHRLRIAEKLNCFLRLVDNDRAIFAVPEMPLEFLLHGQIEIAVDIIGQLADNAFAVQFDSPLRKYWFNF